MRVAVLGAGITGLATAWYLLEDGHDVVVVDRNAGPGLGTSYANGAQLSYSYVAPLAGPGVLPKIPPWLLRRDSPLRFYPAIDTHQWHWLFAFVRACNQAQSDATTRRLLRLSFYSRALMHAFVASDAGAQIEFGYARNGKLVVYSDDASFDGARRLVDYQRSLGCEQEALDADRCRALEPALADGDSELAKRLVGGIHTPSEEVGDCYAFCVGLERAMANRGVKFVYDTAVEHLRRAAAGARTIAALQTHDGAVEADRYVLASGAASPFLVRELGLDLPIYPLKGYSITVPATSAAPRISITDYTRKVVYAPLRVAGGEPPARATVNGELRAAGIADLAGYKATIDPVRLDQLVREARGAFPHAAANHYEAEASKPWAGLRPATPKGTPILGASPFSNLFFNVGHGALGWTLALGSGRIVADAVAGRAPAIALDGLVYGD
jgi:D-amino-acid dehydrogenase